LGCCFKCETRLNGRNLTVREGGKTRMNDKDGRMTKGEGERVANNGGYVKVANQQVKVVNG